MAGKQRVKDHYVTSMAHMNRPDSMHMHGNDGTQRSVLCLANRATYELCCIVSRTVLFQNFQGPLTESSEI